MHTPSAVPASHSRDRAPNSADAHWPAIISRPKPVRLAIARLTRDSRTRRPSRYPASRWNIRCSLDRYRLAAMRHSRSVPGTQRRTRWTSASLPVLTMPSSLSTAASSVTTQSGCGVGPRSNGVDRSQVDQRSPSSGRSSSVGCGSRWGERFRKSGSSSSNRWCRPRPASS